MFAASMIIVLVICLTIVHSVLDRLDRKRGEHITLVRVGTDLAYETFEMVKVKNRVRVVPMHWSNDWSRVERGSVKYAIQDQGSIRANLIALSEHTGIAMTVSEFTMDSYVKTTQDFFDRAGLTYGS